MIGTTGLTIGTAMGAVAVGPAVETSSAAGGFSFSAANVSSSTPALSSGGAVVVTTGASTAIRALSVGGTVIHL